ncbi:MAG: hypothetical protein GXY52_00170 [Chloroflexi bacterium]|nr:hypothetical protein [Chloroflexota bacterium]
MRLENEFCTPANQRRVLQIIHGMPESHAERQELFEALLERGFGGIITNVSFKDYLRNEKYWADFIDGLQQARALGMVLWLYDEEGYPSGLAGGLTQAGNPEFQSEGVAYYHTCGTGELTLDLPAGELVYACWAPLDGDEVRWPAQALAVSPEDRRLRWQAGDVPSVLMAFVRHPLYEGTHAAANVHKHQPYINIIDDRAMAKFLSLTHETYEARLRSGLGMGVGEVFEALFTDEPSLMTGFLIGDPQPAPVIPWCYDITERYQERWGEALLPLLPLLFVGQGQAQALARYRFWQLISDLVEERYFGLIQRWAKAHGIASSGHQLLEESIVAHTYYYGDFMQSARRLDWPSIDQLTTRLKFGDAPLHAKLLSSVAELNDGARVMSETSDHVQRVTKQPMVSDTEIKGIFGWQYLLGVNVITSYYGWDERKLEWDADAPDPKRDWSDLNAYLGRLGILVQDARWQGEIGLVYPIEAAWAHFITQRVTYYDRQEPEEVIRIDDLYQNLGKTLINQRFDFTILDRPALAAASSSDGELATGPLSLSCLIIPRMQYIAAQSMQAAYDLWIAGGKVLAVGVAPQYEAETAQAGRVSTLAGEMFGALGEMRASPAGGQAVLVADIDAALAQLAAWQLSPLTVTPADAPIVYSKRKLADGRISWMFLNRSDQPVKATVQVDMAQGKLWDPETGTITVLEVPPSQGVPLELAPFRAAFVVQAI